MLFSKIKWFFKFFWAGERESSVKLNIAIDLQAISVMQKRDTYLGGLGNHGVLELA